jgi:hypothetical protein
MIINDDGSQVNLCGGCLKNFLTQVHENFSRRICSVKRARGSCENS